MGAPRPGGKLRASLLLGFGGLLLLLVIAGWQALSTVGQLHAAEQTARDSFAARNQALIEFRSDLDIYGNRVDQYVLSYTPGSSSGDGRDLSALFFHVQGALRGYPPDRQPEEQAMLTSLQALVADQERALYSMIAAARPDLRGRLLQTDVIPRNRRIISSAEKVAVWNHRQLTAASAALLAGFANLRSRLARLLLVILASGLLLAIGSIVYIAGQDREARKRYRELSESRDALSELSARLLDAQEEERRSISRELHDEVGQALGALLVDVGRLSAQFPGDDPPLQEQLTRMRGLAERSVRSVRNMALLLRPSMLDDLGLIAALEWQGREISRRSEMEVDIQSVGVSDDLPDELKTCVYRVVQEALNNAARHSHAQHARVDVTQTAHQITVAVKDDGDGFDPNKTRGLGLLGMEERVRHLHGTLLIRSKPGEGSVVSAELPAEQKVAA